MTRFTFKHSSDHNVLFWRDPYLVSHPGLKINTRKVPKLNASYFDNLQVRKYQLANLCTQISQMFGNSHQFANGKILLAKLCKWIKKLTLSPDSSPLMCHHA